MNLKIQLIAIYTMLRKETQRILRIWIQTLVPPAITMSLYFFIFGKLIGERIGNMGGFNYIDFIIPGLVMMAIITNSYANVVSSFFGSKFSKSVEELIVAPVSPLVIILGFVFGGIVRGFMVGIVVLVVSCFFTKVKIYSFSLILLFSFLAAILFSLAGFMNALMAKKFDDISIIPTFVLAPLTYLGGVFYNIENMTPFWKNISLFNPILYLVSALRYSFLGQSDISIYTSFLVIIIPILILFSLNLYFLNKGIGLRT